MSRNAAEPATHTVSVIRRALRWIIVFGLAGLEVELVLIKHTEGAWELAPIALMGFAVVPLVWAARWPNRGSLRFFQGTMWGFVLLGVLGVLLHFRANVDWERESNPSLAGIELYMKALRGATPMLAPGAMVQLGLVGLVFAYRHPVLGVPEREPTSRERELS
jgi:hypothetical protein